MGLSKTQMIIVGVVLFVVLFFVLGFMGIIPGFKKDSGGSGDANYPSGNITLEIWGTGNKSTDFTDIVKSYQATHKNVKINYTEFSSWSEYEKNLVNAMAERKGPDIFMIHNSWVIKHSGKILPAYPALMPSQTVKQLYPDVVYRDFVKSGQVFALPLFMDSLALIYNKDIFNSRAVVFPPRAWQEVLDYISKLNILDVNKNIQVSAIALGSAKNIGNIADILSMLMLQNGSTIIASDGSGVRFDSNAQKALSFYMQFSNKKTPYYSWDDGFKNSRQAFADEKVSMIIDYASAVKEIKSKNPFINIGTSLVPQTSAKSSVGFANYAGLTVSRQSLSPYAAWDFVRYITSNESVNALYLEKTGKLPALLMAIKKGIGGDYDAFLRGALIAKNWDMPDYFGVKSVFGGMISDIISGKADEQRALKAAEQSINNLY